MNSPKKLGMKFDPNVIEHLGVLMYSTLPPVLSELIANSYDADATKVTVELWDKGEKKIIVTDNGHGMSLDDIQTKFLIIGRNRREAGENMTEGGRCPIGKKGLGKLSFFGIVHTIQVDTVRNGKRNVFEMDWRRVMSSGGQYLVDHKTEDELTKEDSRTIITLTNIKRTSLFSEESIAISISKFFIFDEDFLVSISNNDEPKIKVTNQMRFDSLEPEFSWELPKDFRSCKEYDYLKKTNIRGEIITSKNPIKPSTHARGITLFSRNKLVHTPYQFAESTSSHFFSYLSGWLEIDFIDDIPEDVITTNRQSLNWEHAKMKKLHEKLKKCVQRIEREWREKRRQERENQFRDSAGVAQTQWIDSMPLDIKPHANLFLQSIENIPAIDEDKAKELFEIITKAIPLYPHYHQRHLHVDLKNRLFKRYESKLYLDAAAEGEKIYQYRVRKESNSSKSGSSLFQEVFSEKNPILEIKHPFPSAESHGNIQRGQLLLSSGLMASFRNLISHHSEEEIQNFFNEDDCLDVLSLISFLLRRVDNATMTTKKKASKKKKSK